MDNRPTGVGRGSGRLPGDVWGERVLACLRPSVVSLTGGFDPPGERRGSRSGPCRPARSVSMPRRSEGLTEEGFRAGGSVLPRTACQCSGGTPSTARGAWWPGWPVSLRWTGWISSRAACCSRGEDCRPGRGPAGPGRVCWWPGPNSALDFLGPGCGCGRRPPEGSGIADSPARGGRP